VESTEDEATFASTFASSSQGSLAMVGRAGLGSIDGELVWQKADGSAMRYRFPGQRMHMND